MTQRLVAIGDDHYVENEAGAQVFVIDGSTPCQRHSTDEEPRNR